MWSELKNHRALSPISAFLLKLPSVQKSLRSTSSQLDQLEIFCSVTGIMKILHSFVSHNEDNKALSTPIIIDTGLQEA
jgi:hypothetical protein